MASRFRTSAALVSTCLPLVAASGAGNETETAETTRTTSAGVTTTDTTMPGSSTSTTEDAGTPDTSSELGGDPPGPDPSCDGETGDVDGDGHDDLVSHQTLAQGGNLEACLATGAVLRIPGAGQEGLLLLIDVEPDGRAEIFYGATTAGAIGYELALLHDGELTDAGLQLWFGNAVDEPGTRMAWGCRDVDADGNRELIDASAWADADVVSWRWTAYDIENGGVDLAGVDSGVAPPGSDPAVVVGGLVDDC